MAVQSTPNKTESGFILGIDVGDVRVGMALASTVARLPRPYGVLVVDDTIYRKILDVVLDERITKIVVGLPRNMNGEETAQSAKIREFAQELQKIVNIPVEFADESLSSKRAEQMAKASKDRPKRAPLDDLAACFILEEFFDERGSV